MAFNRVLEPPPYPEEKTVNAWMAGIGMNFAVEPDSTAPIEETLVVASEAGMEKEDLRVLAVLSKWLEIHHASVNADRLFRLVEHHPSERVRAYWTAVAQWLQGDRRFSRLRSLRTGSRVDVLPSGTDFHIARKGEDSRFAATVLRVPAGVLRDRASDVLTREDLAHRHRGYRNRLVMGPSWRADVWTVLEGHPGLSAAELARRAKCSFTTAWQAKQDFSLLYPLAKGQ